MSPSNTNGASVSSHATSRSLRRVFALIRSLVTLSADGFRHKLSQVVAYGLTMRRGPSKIQIFLPINFYVAFTCTVVFKMASHSSHPSGKMYLLNAII